MYLLSSFIIRGSGRRDNNEYLLNMWVSILQTVYSTAMTNDELLLLIYYVFGRILCRQGVRVDRGQIVRGMRDSFKRTLTASRAISRMNGDNKSVYLYSLRSLVGSLDQVMLLGDSGVGKTCLLVRFRDGTFLSGNFISTVGIDFRVRAFAQLTINVVLSFYCVL